MRYEPFTSAADTLARGFWAYAPGENVIKHTTAKENQMNCLRILQLFYKLLYLLYSA